MEYCLRQEISVTIKEKDYAKLGLQSSGRIRRPEATPRPCGDSEHYAEFEMKVGRKLSFSSYSIPGSRESVLPDFLDAVPLFVPRAAREAPVALNPLSSLMA